MFISFPLGQVPTRMQQAGVMNSNPLQQSTLSQAIHFGADTVSITAPQPQKGRFQGKSILVAVSGGIAAYKACDVIRMLQKEGAKKVVAMMTPHAKEFIGPLTLESLTMNPVLIEHLENTTNGTPTHIAMAQEMDAMVVVPATAETIKEMAHGGAGNLLTSTALTFTNKPLIIAPAMNTRMWENPLVQQNIQTLRSLPNVTIVPPGEGLLACGEVGEGKLADVSSISLHTYQATHPFRNLYKGKTVVVTTGGTEEPIDSVRIISNISSGKMGLAVADELFAMGANVILVHTLDGELNKPYETVPVKSVKEMEKATKEAFARADGLVMAAAVSDFTPKNVATGKIKKMAEMVLPLVKTHDFLVDIGQSKKAEQFVVGFAAESSDLVQNAKGKLERKNLDMIVANDISRKDIGFKSDENEVTLLFREGENVLIPKASKAMIARGFLKQLHERCPALNAEIKAPEAVKAPAASESKPVIPQFA